MKRHISATVHGLEVPASQPVTRALTVPISMFVLALVSAAQLIGPEGWAEHGKPAWVKKFKDADLEKTGMLQGFGSVESTGDAARDRESADSQALQDLAKQIHVHVEGESVDTWAEKLEGGKRQTLSDVRSRVRTSVDFTLQNVNFRRWPEKEKTDKYYALAYLDPAAAADRVAEEIKALCRRLQESREMGREALKRGEIRKAIVFLLRARWEWLQATSHAANYEVLRRKHQTAAEGLIPGGLAALSPESLWTDLVHGLHLDGVSGGNQKVTEGQLPQQPLVARLRFSGEESKEGEAVPVAGVPVRFSLLNAEGALQAGVPMRTRGLSDAGVTASSSGDSEAATDSEGQVACQVLAMKSPSGPIQSVTATVDLERIAGEVREVDVAILKGWLSPLAKLKTVFVFEQAGVEELSLEQWVQRQASRLMKHAGWPKQPKVLVGAFTYRDTQAAGELGRKLHGLFWKFLSESGVQLLPTDPHGIGVLLRGEYQEDQEQVEVKIFAEDRAGTQLAAISAFIGRDKVSAFPLKLAEEPQRFEKHEAVLAAVSDPGVASQKDFCIQIWTDRGKAPVYQDGEEMTVYLKATRDCYVRVVYITADQQWLLIYPNRWGSDDFLRAGDTLELPGKGSKFRFVVQKPFGPETLKVIAANHPLAMPDGKQLDGAMLLGDPSPRALIRGMRGMRVEARTGDEPPPSPALAESFIVVNTQEKPQQP
ncbi:MAG: DUF4384 domain-containing protein [Planctomycetes bacterium]|nr:DUF4384 domain-containing protein [Planctomycetota bacterium]